MTRDQGAKAPAPIATDVAPMNPSRGYAVDGLPLTGEEALRHRGSCNAALSGLAGEQWEGDLEADVQNTANKAFDYADAMVRTYRLRCAAAAPAASAPTGMFLLDDPYPAIGCSLDEWAATQESRRPELVALVRALRKAGAERTPFNGIAMVDLAPVRGEDVYRLAKVGVLREATPEECRAAGAERWTPYAGVREEAGLAA